MPKARAATKAASRMLLISFGDESGATPDVPGGCGDPSLRACGGTAETLAARRVAAGRAPRGRARDSAVRADWPPHLPHSRWEGPRGRGRKDLRGGRPRDRG